MVFFMFLVLRVHLAPWTGRFIIFIMIGIFSVMFLQNCFFKKFLLVFSETPNTPILGLLKLLYDLIMLCSVKKKNLTGVSFWIFSVVQGFVFPNLFSCNV